MASFFGGQMIPAYAAAKGGVGELTKELSNYLSGRGVNVNAIAPGYMATNLNTELLVNEVRYKQISERIPNFLIYFNVSLIDIFRKTLL